MFLAFLNLTLTMKPQKHIYVCKNPTPLNVSRREKAQTRACRGKPIREQERKSSFVAASECLLWQIRMRQLREKMLVMASECLPRQVRRGVVVLSTSLSRQVWTCQNKSPTSRLPFFFLHLLAEEFESPTLTISTLT